MECLEDRQLVNWYGTRGSHWWRHPGGKCQFRACNWIAYRSADPFLNAFKGIYTLIETAKLNDIDPQAWLADVLARLPHHPAKRIAEILPWNWRTQNLAAKAA